MKLMFLTLAPLSSNAGHLARLSTELYYLAELNEINIVCLGNNPDNEETKSKYKNISFFHSPVNFNGWKIVNLPETIKNINGLVKKIHPDLVILQMEVWDLTRELGSDLKGRVAFAVITHAMPFLTAPINPSGNFEQDVIEYVNTRIEKYRKDYIINHYKEIYSVFKNISIIANNRTVAFYLKTYFKDLRFWTLAPSIATKINKNIIVAENPTYDFVYMARMEAGKGIEYLSEILKRISLILKRSVNMAILGKTDDTLSKNALNQLLIESKQNKYFNISYFGWADEICKRQVLSTSGIFLYPSHYDNYPTVLNEALTFGLPCITWDVPFSKLNYSATKAVKRISLLDFQRFAESVTESLLNKNTLVKHALDFVNSFDSPAKIAQSDTDIFKEIVSFKNEEIKSYN